MKALYKKNLTYFFLFGSLIFCSSLLAQTEIDTLMARNYFQKGESLLTERKLDSAILYFNKALPIYKKAKIWEHVINSYNKIASAYLRNNELKKSLKISEISLELIKKKTQQNNLLEAEVYQNMAQIFKELQKYDKAKNYINRALKIRKLILPKYHSKIAICFSILGIINQSTAHLEESLEQLKKALEIDSIALGPKHKKLANHYINLGTLYNEIGDIHKSIQYSEKYLEINLYHYGPEHVNIGLIYVNLGYIYSTLKQFTKANSYYQKALPILLSNKHLYGLGILYLNIGVIAQETGKYEDALSYFKKSINTIEQLYGKNHYYVAVNYLNIGANFHQKKEYSKSLNHYNKALEICKEIFDENHYLTAEIYLSMSNVYADIGEITKAFEYNEKGFKIQKTVYGKNSPEIVKSYVSIAEYNAIAGHEDKALNYYEKALTILKNKYSKKNSLASKVLNDIANLYIAKKEYYLAIDYYNKSIYSNSKTEIQVLDNQKIIPHNYFDQKELLTSLQGKVLANQLLYSKHKDLKNLNASITISKQALSLIHHIRYTYRNYMDKLAFGEQTKKNYSQIIESLLLKYKESKNFHDLVQAFVFNEKSKANALKTLLNDYNSKNFSSLPSKIINFEQNLKIDQAFYISQIINERSKPKIDSSKINLHENKLFEISRSQDSLTKELEKKYPRYYKLKHQDSIISLVDVKKKLHATSTLVEFFTADSTTYAFTITKDSLFFREINTKNLQETINAFRNTITSKNNKKFKKLSHHLYTLLISPIRSHLAGDELIIVPDGPLWHLNFDLLLTNQNSSNNPKDFPYLLKDFAISYANSANLLFNSFSTPKSKNQKLQECLAFSFSDSTKIVNNKEMSLATLRDAGDDLPGTRAEIKAISDIVDGQYFYGSEAVESNFKQHASKYNILHLALHGEVDNERPENSKLYFTKSKDTLEDNFLYSHELFALDIPAELTVLSACNTGSGKIAKGEGIMSLGNAFQYAGTKSLLLSSWEVSDQTTPELMKFFYTNLKEGMSKSKALQQAKLQYLQTAEPQRTAPFYWGGFYLVGDAAPMEFSNPMYWYWIVLGTLGLLLLSVIRFFYKRKNSEN